MMTIYKVTKNDGTRGGNGLFTKEWFCATKELAEAFKNEKEKSEHSERAYRVTAVEVMSNADDFYTKELR